MNILSSKGGILNDQRKRGFFSIKGAEKEEMKDETHEVEDTEQVQQDAENENDADYQQD